MPLHDLALVGCERARLEKDAVWYADLADVVHRAGVEYQLAGLIAPADATREQGRSVAHAQDVLARFVVAKLRCAAQAAHDVQPRLSELQGALVHQLLEQTVLVMHQALGHVRHQRVVDAGQKFPAVERLAEKVAGSAVQCTQQIVLARLCGKHHDGRLQRVGQGPDLVHHGVAVEVRHVDVQQDQVRTRCPIARHHLARILDQLDLAVTFGAQHQAEQLEVGRLIVDHHDARHFGVEVSKCRGCHRVLVGIRQAAAVPTVGSADRWPWAGYRPKCPRT